MSDNEEELYDEFGNYIGPDLDDSSSEDESEHEEEEEEDLDLQETANAAEASVEAVPPEPERSIILHEDKEHYETAEQVYGEDVRAVVLDEDAMDIDVPIVEPVKQTSKQTNDVSFIYSDDYLSIQLSNETGLTRRGIAIVGHLHHGKTSLVDLLLEPTLTEAWGPRASLEDQPTRYLDSTQPEKDRKMSLKSTAMTTLLNDTRGKSYCISIMDCPGHVNFHDETCAALRAMDGAAVVVDIVEGLQAHTEMCIQQIIAEGLPMVLVITKMDRLIVELKLPPNDAYHKIHHLIETVNNFIHVHSRGRYPKLSPDQNNVCFCSNLHGWLFTVESFANLQALHNNDLGIPETEFAKRLWGDCYLDPNTRMFKMSARDCTPVTDKPVQRTFVEFVLEPLYKIYAACLGEINVESTLRRVGVLLRKEELRASARPLLRKACSKFLGTSGFVDMLVKCIPHPFAAARGKLARCYTGTPTKAMAEGDPNGPLVIHCVKNYPSLDGQSFWTFGRVYSGTVRPAETVKVLGEGYTPHDDEDVAIATVAALAIPRGRNQLHVNMVKAGNWVLLQGVDATIAKTATIVGNNISDQELNEMNIFAPLKFPFAGGESIFKLAIEPLNPAELPKMVEGLRRITKSYPMATTKVEESGEHVVFGTGELYMDCLMHDLRHLYSDIEVKVADPIVAFRETVVETSSVKCFAETANKRNKLTFIAEPMDEGLAEQLESGTVKLDWDKKKMGRFFQTKYSWDLLSSRSVWAFGDSPTHGTNILMDDTLPGEVDKKLLSSCRSSIVQGFQWATREGPLCEEPVRATKIKILDATFSDKAIFRGGGQVIPTARRTVHSALLTATPRLMEPVYRLDIQCPSAIVENMQDVVTRRRGHITQDRPISGSLLSNVKGFLPVLDSFGFETDLRMFTQGQAMVSSTFDHWALVPGDPLDKDIILHPLEPSPPQFLARELLVKTRRRKGLSEDVSTTKFFDEGMKSYLASQEDTMDTQ